MEQLIKVAKIRFIVGGVTLLTGLLCIIWFSFYGQDQRLINHLFGNFASYIVLAGGCACIALGEALIYDSWMQKKFFTKILHRLNYRSARSQKIKKTIKYCIIMTAILSCLVSPIAVSSFEQYTSKITITPMLAP